MEYKHTHYEQQADGHMQQINGHYEAANSGNLSRHPEIARENAEFRAGCTNAHFLQHTAYRRMISNGRAVLHEPAEDIAAHLEAMRIAHLGVGEPHTLVHDQPTVASLLPIGHLTHSVPSVNRDGNGKTWAHLYPLDFDHEAIYNLHAHDQHAPIALTFYLDAVSEQNLRARARAPDSIPAIGACYLPASSNVELVGWLCAIRHTHNTGSNMCRTLMHEHDVPIMAGTLVPLRPMRFSAASAVGLLNACTTDAFGSFVFITAPHRAANGALLGGSSAGSNAAGEDTDLGFEGTLAPPMSTVQRLDLRTINVELPPTDVVDAAAKAEDAMPSNDFLRMFPIDHDANVDATTNCLLTRHDGIIMQEQTAGCYMRPWLETQQTTPLKFTTRLGSSNKTIQLAPIFAGITATWLDRNAVASLTTAANWMGSTRSTEMDPITKAALRSAAAQPIELTALYVRLWGLYYSSAIAVCRGEEYKPTIDNNTRHIVRNINSYSDWASVLSLSHNTKVMPMFFDSMALQYVEDITHPLAIATARRVYTAGSANAFWVPIPGLQLYTNGTGPNVITGNLTPWAITQCIDWLTASTDTQSQSLHAQCLVASLLYRPQGYGIYHGQQHATSRALVALPRCNTKGQYLLPLSLWATTLDPELPEQARHGNPPDMLRAAAAMSLTHLYTMATSVRMINTPAWWPRQYRMLNARITRLMLRVNRAGWYPALLAAHLRKSYAGSGHAQAMLHMWPQNSSEIHKLNQAEMLGCLSFLPLSRQPHASDDEAAIFAKIKLVDNIDSVKLGRPIVVRALTQSDNPQYIIPHANTAGCTTELHLIDQLTSTIVHKVPTTNLTRGYARVPPALTQNIRTCLTITIPDIHAAFKLKSLLHNLNEGTWYLSGPETFIGSEAAPAPSESHDPTAGLPTSRIAGAAAAPKKPSDSGDSDSEGHSDDRAAQAPNDYDDGLNSVSKPQPPPSHLEAQRLADPIVTAMIKHAVTGMRPESAHIYEQLAEWKIPTALVHDNESLNWLADNMGITLNPKYAYSDSCDIGPILQAIREQVKLNTMRNEAQLLRTMFTEDPSSRPTGSSSIEDAIARLMPQLPKNGAVAVVPATTATATE